MNSTLVGLGFSEKYFLFLQQQFPDFVSTNLARVASVHRTRTDVLTLDGVCTGLLSGRLIHEGVQLCVGDWVRYEELGDKQVYVQDVLPRISFLSRSFSAKDFSFTKGLERQGIVANVDCIYVVLAADDDFSVRRLERYLVCCQNSGSRVAVILNKIDKPEQIAPFVDLIKQLSADLEIFCVSALHNIGIDDFKNQLSGTVAFIGSSGVGKSSIINAVLGFERQKTGEIRLGDEKGKHITTSRDLIVTEHCIIIDNPGLREIQVWAEEEDLAEVFKDIEAAALRCVYRNCLHVNEIGCAVLEAVATGKISKERLANFKAIGAEVKRVQDFQSRDSIRKTERTRKTRIQHHLAMKGKR